MKFNKVLLSVFVLVISVSSFAQEQDTITYNFLDSSRNLRQTDSLSSGMIQFRQAYQNLILSNEVDVTSISESSRQAIVQSVDSLQQQLETIDQAQSDESTSARTSSAASSAGGGSASPGESGTSTTVVALPSPSSLGKVSLGSDMVNLYTGDLNYGIPLYSLESRDLSIPISIHYNSGSNKVDNIASEVGLGWSLNAGGLITRVMKGLPDEFQGSINTSPKPGATNEFNGYGWLKVKSRKIENKTVAIIDPNDFKSRYSVESRKNIIENSALGGDVTNQITKTEGWDTEPDEFYFNFGKYSGKFVFTRTGEIHTVPNQNLEIEEKIGTVNGKDQIIEFTVITPEGITYTFGSSDESSLDAVEFSQMYTYSNSTYYDYPFLDYINIQGFVYVLYTPVPFMNWKFNRANEWIYNNDNRNQWKYPEFASTWYLKKVKSQNDQIDFAYNDQGEVTYFQGKSINVKMPNIPRISVDGVTVGLSVEDFAVAAQRKIFPELSSHTRSYQYMILQSKRLESITTSTGTTAYFDSYGTRKDLVGSSRLRRIRVNQGNKEIVSYKFNQSYMQSDGELYTILEGFHEGEPMYYIEDELVLGLMKTFDDQVTDNEVIRLADSEHFRLRLDALVEVRNGNELPPTKFTYNETKLPRRFSADQDKWGYFNSNNRNTLMVRPSYKSVLNGGGTINTSLFYWDQIKTDLNTTVEDLVAKWECQGNNCARLGGVRSVNTNRIKAGLLTKVDHNLGGSTSFNYETKKAAYGGKLFTIGGAKVLDVTSTPNDQANKEVISYKFEDGRAPNSVSFAYSLKSSDYFQDEIHRTFTFSSHPITSSFMTQGSFAGFGLVTVYQANKGKSVYEFVTPLDIENKRATIQEYNLGNQSGNNQYPFAPERNDWMRGKIKKVSHFREGETKPFFNVSYEYELSESNLIYGMKPGSYGYRSLLGGGFPAFEAAFYSYNSAVYRVKETIEKMSGERAVEDYVTKTSTYDYVDAYPQYTRGITTTYEDGTQEKVSSKYVFDYFDEGDEIPTLATLEAEGLWDLKDHGYAYTPIEIVQRRRMSESDSWSVVGGELSTFQRGSRFDSNSGSSEVYLKEKFALVLSSPATSFAESNMNGTRTLFNKDGRYRAISTYMDYNAHGRPLFTKDRSGMKTKISWTHYNSLISEITLNSGGNVEMQSTYQYEPLIGITQTKDENNKLTRYTYDNFSRLYMVRDNENRIMERYRYNYRNQSQSTNFYTNFRSSGGYNLACSSIRLASTDTDAYGASEYTWDFGDSGISEDCPSLPGGDLDGRGDQAVKGKTVYHRFPKAGTYDVTVNRFSPDEGKEASRTNSITIYDTKATVKIFAPETVKDCGNDNNHYDSFIPQNELHEETLLPIDDDDNGDGGGNPNIYVRIGYAYDGAICNEGGYSSASLSYKDAFGQWKEFSNTSSGTVPDDIFNYKSAPFTLELKGTFSDKCSSTIHNVTGSVDVVTCSTNTGGGGTGGVWSLQPVYSASNFCMDDALTEVRNFSIAVNEGTHSCTNTAYTYQWQFFSLATRTWVTKLGSSASKGFTKADFTGGEDYFWVPGDQCRVKVRVTDSCGTTKWSDEKIITVSSGGNCGDGGEEIDDVFGQN